MNQPILQLNGFSFEDLLHPQKLALLDQHFLNTLKASNNQLYIDLINYRKNPRAFTALQVSNLLLASAPILEDFLAKLFGVEKALNHSRLATLAHDPIFAFKKWFVMRRAKRRLSRPEDRHEFAPLNNWLEQQLLAFLHNETGENLHDKELITAKFAITLLENEEQQAEAIEQLTLWCISAITTSDGQAAVKHWVSFKLPQPLDYQRLIPIFPVSNSPLQALPDSQQRPRDGFKLTDPRMNEREVQSEVHYCIYCHDHDGDFCSKGFPEKKGKPELGLRKNALDNILTGCPLDEKISEMNSLKRDAHTIAALAVVMIDNPMCPATGHRICNDCMRSCIYQKQDPVDIPQIETRVLVDVLNLPWGVEIYDLLTRWNPLRSNQWVAKPYNGLKTFISGMGPAGFTLAHHLLMEGFAVVGTDGLKIEPLPERLLKEPVHSFTSLVENLDDRLVAGFGGVAEYGITPRWDKNFLKLIYLSLMRRPYFQVYGGVRFGGTVTVDTIWQLGFDHMSIAVGAGLPRALPIPGSLARGMRQANDFLMALQLTGAAKKTSLANLQLRMPVVVIGGGLTGVDTATEAQAYYIAQVEKTLERYQKLVDHYGEIKIRGALEGEALAIIDEFLTHGKQVKAERQRAHANNEIPNFIPLLHRWGGITIAYRRSMRQSPAYETSHEELNKALEEGLFYAEGLQPKAVQIDTYGHAQFLVCIKRRCDEEGVWHDTEEEVILPARAILVATGAQPNIAYEFEHQGTFARNGLEYQPYEDHAGKLEIVDIPAHNKIPEFGPFTSYQQQDKRISFVGDAHPVFSGKVVKAIASALRTYPKIVELFGDETQQITDELEYQTFAEHIRQYFTTYVKQVNRRADDIVELIIHAPMAAQQWQPGQFFRVQNYETHAKLINNTRLQMEALALLGVSANRETGEVKLLAQEAGTSSRLCAFLQPGEPIAIMGPTGVRSKLPDDKETILIFGNRSSIIYLLAVAPALRSKGNRVVFIVNFKEKKELFCQQEIEENTDAILWSVQQGELITANRPQDISTLGDAMQVLSRYAHNEYVLPIVLNEVNRITVLGNNCLLRQFQQAKQEDLAIHLNKQVKVFGASYAPMQCMLKGVCAQCLQWQIDPQTKQRKKAVFACSWQDQPLDLIDTDNLNERQLQNRPLEILSNFWLDYILENKALL